MPGKNILIVDDESSIRVMLMRMIEPLGHTMVMAEDGRVAYDFLKEQEFDLIISDLLMPNMGGLELLEKLRDDGIDSAFIILTGFGDLPQALAARDRFNIANFLVKPIHNMDQFLFDVEAAISRRLLERENRSLLSSLQDMNVALEAKVDERTRELREKNDELALLSNFRADVLQVLGHELRTPLAVLSGYHHLSMQGPPEARENMNSMMGSSIQRLQEKIEKTLLLLKGTERTQFPLEMEPVDPVRMCETVRDRIAPFIKERGIEIVTPECPTQEKCVWDREKVEEVIEELLINSIRASEDNTRIDIFIAMDDHMVEFRVRDHGVGIPPDQIERIFEPFVTLGKPSHHKSGLFDQGAEGIGIGLPTAKMWVELHHGSITIQTNEGESGATFVIRLPRNVSLSGASDPGK